MKTKLKRIRNVSANFLLVFSCPIWILPTLIWMAFIDYRDRDPSFFRMIKGQDCVVQKWELTHTELRNE